MQRLPTANSQPRWLFPLVLTLVGLLSALPAFVTAIAPSALFLLLAFWALRWVERH